MLSTLRAIFAGIGFFMVGLGVILGYAVLALYLVLRAVWRLFFGSSRAANVPVATASSLSERLAG